MRTASPIKYYGGKSYLAEWILSLAPPHTHWVEVCGGGLSLTLSKDPHGISEVVNDCYGQLQNFWRVLQDPTLFEMFYRSVQATPFSQVQWNEATDVNRTVLAHDTSSDDKVAHAVAFFTACRQSRAGAFQAFTPLSRSRTRRNMNEQVSAWLTAIEGLPAVHSRLQRIVILHDDALAVIRSQDSPSTLFYLDPPYLESSRTAHDVYEHEMTVEDHERLLATLGAIEGQFLLSGYPSEVYSAAEMKYGWHRSERQIPNNASNTRRIMTECVWTNYLPPSAPDTDDAVDA